MKTNATLVEHVMQIYDKCRLIYFMSIYLALALRYYLGGLDRYDKTWFLLKINLKFIICQL